MQLTSNRYFKHKFFNNIIKAVWSKGKDDITHLYIELVEGDEIKGMSGQSRFMLSTGRHIDNWTEQLEEYAANNQYIDHNPFLLSQEEAVSFLEDCYISIREEPSLRLGQMIINHLGNKTPTPNIAIFNERSEGVVTDWFYRQCVSKD